MTVNISSWLKTLEPNLLTYWIGMLMLFVGLSLSVSVATALCVVGGVMVAESLLTNYLVTWINERQA